MSLLPTITKYKSFQRDASNQHFILYALQRPSFMTDLVPTSATVRLKAVKPDGSVKTVDLPWTTEKYDADQDQVLKSSFPFDFRIHEFDETLKQMGQVDPIFITAQTKQQFRFVKVYPSVETRKKFGLDEKQTPPIYAALYKYAGKTVLLVRISSYDPQDYKSDVYMKAYMAIIDEFQDIADVMVLDQTHNPGGSYCADFYDLFSRDGDDQGVLQARADRKWINSLKSIELEEGDQPATGWNAKQGAQWALEVEQAYDQGQFLSEPLPLFTGSTFSQKRDARWTKPMLVLIDELAGSCGDIFPMLVKANHRAKLFGQNTVGAGGNVEEVGVLVNSRIHVSMTRGLFYPYNPNHGPSPGDFVEANGVAPDYVYTHTVDDFRGGYTSYVKAFSDKAIEQLQ